MSSSTKVVGSNWSKLKRKISSSTTDEKQHAGKLKKKRTDIVESLKAKSQTHQEAGVDEAPVSDKERDRYVGLDCEMVGIGSNAKKSVLARCCLVNFDGEKLYDEYVRPKSFVTDFRTKYSGVRRSDLRKGNAVTLEECMQDVSRILEGKILVGHALHNDLDVLMLKHHRSMIRDTATYRPYMRPHGGNGGKMRPRALKDLTKEYLGITIQEGEHDPGVDAKMAMLLYRRQRKTWEEQIRLAAKEKMCKIKASKSAKTKEQSLSGKLTQKHKNTKRKSSMFDDCS